MGAASDGAGVSSFEKSKTSSSLLGAGVSRFLGLCRTDPDLTWAGINALICVMIASARSNLSSTSVRCLHEYVMSA